MILYEKRVWPFALRVLGVLTSRALLLMLLIAVVVASFAIYDDEHATALWVVAGIIGAVAILTFITLMGNITTLFHRVEIRNDGLVIAFKHYDRLVEELMPLNNVSVQVTEKTAKKDKKIKFYDLTIRPKGKGDPILDERLDPYDIAEIIRRLKQFDEIKFTTTAENFLKKYDSHQIKDLAPESMIVQILLFVVSAGIMAYQYLDIKKDGDSLFDFSISFNTGDETENMTMVDVENDFPKNWYSLYKTETGYERRARCGQEKVLNVYMIEDEWFLQVTYERGAKVFYKIEKIEKDKEERFNLSLIYEDGNQYAGYMEEVSEEYCIWTFEYDFYTYRELDSFELVEDNDNCL